MLKDQLEKMKDMADIMAARDGKGYAVVDLGGDYQIWPKSLIDKNGSGYVYVTGEVVPVNDWDELLS